MSKRNRKCPRTGGEFYFTRPACRIVPHEPVEILADPAKASPNNPFQGAQRRTSIESWIARAKDESYVTKQLDLPELGLRVDNQVAEEDPLETRHSVVPMRFDTGSNGSSGLPGRSPERILR